MRKVFADSSLHSFEGFVSRHADLDGVVTPIDCEDGLPIKLNGWLFSFEFEVTPLQTFNVHGSHGVLTCDARTGEVIAYEPAEPNSEEGYHDIGCFDVAEWCRAYPGQSIIGASLDILDLGYWTEAEQYEGPEIDWRAEYRKSEG